MTLKYSLVIFQALEPLQPQWPQRPLKPHWPHQPLQPYFIKKLPEPDGWIITSTKMTNTGPFLWNGSLKFQFFTDIWYPFCRRLLRPAFATFLKTGCKYQNVITSGIYRTHYIHEIINPDTCQSQFTLYISMWDTL
jgi:hypothetical protein